MNNKKYIIAGLFIALLGVVLSHTYRFFIYENHIYDFHIADTIGSLLCVPSSVLFFYGISNKYSIRKLIFITALTFTGYEFLGLMNIHGTFDLFDIIAIIISSLFTYFCFKWNRVI